MVASVSAHNHVKSIILLPSVEEFKNPLGVLDAEGPGMTSMAFSTAAVEMAPGSASLDIVDVAAVLSLKSVLLGLSLFKSSAFMPDTTDPGRGGMTNFG